MTNLKKENKKLSKKIDELYENIDMWATENTKFRELLEESKHIMSIEKNKLYKLITKINKALGEE